jgi:hypothetical protein
MLTRTTGNNEHNSHVNLQSLVSSGRMTAHDKIKVPTVGQDEWYEKDPSLWHETDTLQDHLKTPVVGHEEILTIQREQRG